MPLLIVAFNTLLFVGLSFHALSMARKSSSKSVRLLWGLVALSAFALVVGGIQRLALQGIQRGWLSGVGLDLVLFEWQIVQSIIVAVLGIGVFLGMQRVGHRLEGVESMAGAMMDRVVAVDVEALNLTPREQEVLDLLGSSYLVDNKTLAEKLGVSTDTVHTHVNALLRKSKLHDRRDLAVVAYVHRSRRED